MGMRNRYAYTLQDRYDGEVIVKCFEPKERDIMMREVSKHICFSDCDDTFVITNIIYGGRELQYAGWKPCMLMEYVDNFTGEVVWSGQFEQWDH